MTSKFLLLNKKENDKSRAGLFAGRMQQRESLPGFIIQIFD